MGRGLPGVRESMTTGKRQQQLLCAPGLAMAAFLAIMLWFGLSRASMGAGAMPVEDEQRTEYGSFEMEMIYKYSQRFQEVTKGRPEWEHLAEDSWVRLETAEFYHKLVTEDRHRHASRNLLTADDAYSLSPTNATYFIRTLGSIHYSLLELGTPPKLFLVGLDTGSDLLWVPCDCRQCSKANWASYGLDLNIDFAIYNTSSSTTSKPVPCTSSVCTDTLTTNRTRSCNANAPQLCTYDSNYLSPNTSSSGTLVQDVVYLNPETGTGISNITADIYLGCGSLQTGDFLTGGAPNGLFGLGPAVYSVPSTLARNNVTKNVFSMCFSSTHDVGRLVFGKNPSASLQNTPLLTVDPSLYYVLELEGLKAGDLSLNVSGEAIFDTGTSITTFPSDVSKRLGAALSSKANLESFSFSFSQGTLFSNCWNAT
ncbi:hypothetical protein KP509_36G006500 [Ceratopteris richardii]|nr:hypothetical protein KP509_36G006500 [Ceratopteris richardii]